MSLLIKNIGQLATPQGKTAQRGKNQGNIKFYEDVCIAIENGNISFIGKEKDAPKCEKELDAKGCLVTPGLVDCHTHLVFGGWRHNEMEQKLKGATYLDILKSGGGILSTVKSTREASEEQLFEKAYSLSQEMLSYGTTTVEAKSGYGLNIETELKQLNVVNKLSEKSKLDFVSTFMGAHAIPTEYKENRQGYIDYVINDMLPEIKKSGLAEFCDIFCETGVFDPDESRKILTKAKELGFGIKIHADEIDPIGGGELAGELAAHSAEHLIAATDEGIKKMSQSKTIGVLLPATSLYLDKPFARAKKMIEEGMAVAVATDFNPGSSPNLNIQLPMSLAIIKYKLTPEEALTAVTLNASAAINRSELVGSLEVGKQGDLIIWDADNLNYIFYRYGTNQVKTVVKKGEILISN